MLMNRTVSEIDAGQLIAKRASLARVFEHAGVQGFRHDDRPLPQVCNEKGIDLCSVVRALHEVDETNAWPEHECSGERPTTFTEMVEHILYWHHGYLHHELPRLSRLLSEVAKQFGDEHPELLEVEAEFREVRDGMEIHMLKEEMIFFPICRGLDETGAAPPHFCEAIEEAVRVMDQEHRDVELSLSIIRELTDGFVPPSGVSVSYRILFESLAELDADVQQHVREEEVLFQNVIAAKQRLCRCKSNLNLIAFP